MFKLWRLIAETSGATAVGIASSVVTLMITARLLGPEGRGVYVAASSWVSLFATLGTLSLGQVAVHQVTGRKHAEWLAETTGTALVITGAVTVAGWLLAIALYVASRGRLFGHVSPLLLAIAFLSLPSLLWIDTGRYLVTALDELRIANRAQIANALTALVGIGILVGVVRAGVPGALIAIVLANAAGAALMLIPLVRRAASVVPSLALSKRLLRGGAQLHLSAVGNYLFTQASVLILNYYRPSAETSYYQLAMQLFGLALIVSTAVSTVSFGLVAQKGADGAWPEQRRLIGQSMLVVTVLAAFGYVLAPAGVQLVAGSQFLPAVPLFRIALPALYGATFSTIMASQWIGRGLFIHAAVLTLTVGVVSLALDLFFVPRYGMYGALVSTLVTYALSVVGNTGLAFWIQGQWKHTQAAQA